VEHDSVSLKEHFNAILAERDKAISIALEAGRSNVRVLLTTVGVLIAAITPLVVYLLERQAK
jgi:hypothetical protein